MQEEIYSQIIILKTIVKLSQLRDISIEKLEKTRFTNPSYRSENLQRNLEKTYVPLNSLRWTLREKSPLT